MNSFHSASELQNVKSFTRTKIFNLDFTSRKVRRSRHFLHFKPRKQNLRGFLWCINLDKLSIQASLSMDPTLVAQIFQKWLVFANFWSSQTCYPNLPIFLHGYIFDIRDILQLCSGYNISPTCVNSSTEWIIGWATRRTIAHNTI